MKKFILPYLVQNKNWWSAIDCFNVGPAGVVEVVVRDYDRPSITKKYTKPIAENGHAMFLGSELIAGMPNEAGRFSCLVTCPDGTVLTPLLNSGQSFTICPVYETTTKN